MNAIAVETQAPFVLRSAVPEDVAFIRDSWKRAFLSGGHAPRCERVLYWEGQSDLINRLLSRSEVMVAANPEDASQVFGWVCFERIGRVAVLHFVNVKLAFRGNGVARALLERAIGNAPGLMHSHRTKDGDRLAARLKSTWNPYLLGGIG